MRANRAPPTMNARASGARINSIHSPGFVAADAEVRVGESTCRSTIPPTGQPAQGVAGEMTIGLLVIVQKPVSRAAEQVPEEV